MHCNRICTGGTQLNPVIIIPTYCGGRRRAIRYDVVSTYDHMTPLAHQGELPRCLASLRDAHIDVPVIILVVSEQGIEEQASQKIRGIAAAHGNGLDISIMDAQKLAELYSRADQMGLSSIKDGISLTGYGSIRNLGLALAAIIGYTEVIYIDDDEVIDDMDFVEKACYGLGKLTQKGIPILVKTGYYTDKEGRYKAKIKNAWYDRYWKQGEMFNEWIERAMSGPRLSRSNGAYGGCMAIHREAYRRVSFDPWISRGEDLDYMLNVRMYGSDVWFDNKWTLRHLPPAERTEAQRFRQDIYRWIYQNRKLEYSKTQIDLLQISPRSLYPYPGPFLESSITSRVFITALLRAIGRSPYRKGYFKAAMAARREAKAYAEIFCSKYFEFQFGWPETIAQLENDAVLRSIFGDRRANDAARSQPFSPTDVRSSGIMPSVGTEPVRQSSDEGLLDFELDFDALGIEDPTKED